ncbi:MAG: hypothetical protein NT062_31915 [Proteobacteria bacterium]|nr:hypothetical protein [Pseudomonadota bacterium]
MADDENSNGSGDGQITMSKASYDAALAAARRGGEGRAARRDEGATPAAPTGGSFSFDQVRELVTLMGSARSEPASVRPAAAPNAPVRVDPITAGGLVDIWHLRDDEIAQLGPSGMRTQEL